VISGEIPNIERLIEPAPRLPNVDVRTSTEATAIDVRGKTVEISSKTGKRETLEYDALILATGSYAFKPPVPGMELEGVHVVKTVEDGREIIFALDEAENAVVIGGGAIGIEMAAALRERGLNITLVEMLPSLLPGMLDPDMADSVTQRLHEKGIEVICGQSVKEIRGKEHAKSVMVKGRELPADLVIVAAGVKPEVGLAKAAGIELGETGGIKVDDRLRTSAPDVYAAGDCAESFCPITQRPILSQLATTAIRMGKVAGTNAAGGDAVYSGTLNTVVTCAYTLEIASTGVTTRAAEEAGLKPMSARIRTLSRPRYYPGAEPIIVKLLAEVEQHKLIGGQVLGAEGAAERANMLALAIQHGMTVEEFAKIEYCYAPPVSDCIEPLVVAAEALLRKLQ
jgi:NADH oxidase (H2O2-forming)